MRSSGGGVFGKAYLRQRCSAVAGRSQRPHSNEVHDRAMFDLIDGLPVHPLVVHAVVVMLPLAVLGTVALALRPAWRLRYGWLLVGVTAVATVLVPVATSSGEAAPTRRAKAARHRSAISMSASFEAAPRTVSSRCESTAWWAGSGRRPRCAVSR